MLDTASPKMQILNTRSAGSNVLYRIITICLFGFFLRKMVHNNPFDTWILYSKRIFSRNRNKLTSKWLSQVTVITWISEVLTCRRFFLFLNGANENNIFTWALSLATMSWVPFIILHSWFSDLDYFRTSPFKNEFVQTILFQFQEISAIYHFETVFTILYPSWSLTLLRRKVRGQEIKPSMHQ